MIVLKEYLTEKTEKLSCRDGKKSVDDFFRDRVVWTGFWPRRERERERERERKAERKKTMLGSVGSLNTKVLNCQQQCENDAIKSSLKEKPGEQQDASGQTFFSCGGWNFFWRYLSVEVTSPYIGKSSADGFIQTWQDAQGLSQELELRNMSTLPNTIIFWITGSQASSVIDVQTCFIIEACFSHRFSS